MASHYSAFIEGLDVLVRRSDGKLCTGVTKKHEKGSTWRVTIKDGASGKTSIVSVAEADMVPNWKRGDSLVYTRTKDGVPVSCSVTVQAIDVSIWPPSYAIREADGNERDTEASRLVSADVQERIAAERRSEEAMAALLDEEDKSSKKKSKSKSKPKKKASASAMSAGSARLAESTVTSGSKEGNSSSSAAPIVDIVQHTKQRHETEAVTKAQTPVEEESHAAPGTSVTSTPVPTASPPKPATPSRASAMSLTPSGSSQGYDNDMTAVRVWHGLAFSLSIGTFMWMWTLGLLSMGIFTSMFTMWTCTAVCAYFAGCVIRDLVRSGRRSSDSLDATIDRLFHISLLMSLTCSVLFWAIYSYDRELILPRSFAIPGFLNHAWHTLPPIVMTLDCLLGQPLPLLSRRGAYADRVCVLVISAMYLILLLTIKVRYGKWVYPFLDAAFGFEPGMLFVAFVVVVMALGQGLTMALHACRAQDNIMRSHAKAKAA